VSRIVDVVAWMSVLLTSTMAIAFIVVCFVKARAIGMAGAALLAAYAFVDVGTTCATRAALLLPSTPMDALAVVNVLSSSISTALAVTAFVLLRRGFD